MSGSRTNRTPSIVYTIVFHRKALCLYRSDLPICEIKVARLLPCLDTEEKFGGRESALIHERLHLKVTFDEVAYPSGHRVLVFHVLSRPLGQPVHYKGRYLMRVGEELVPMTPDQLKKIMAEGEPEWALQPATTDCDGEQVVRLLDTQSYSDLLHLP